MSQISGRRRSVPEKKINMLRRFQHEAARVISVKNSQFWIWRRGGWPTRKTIEEAVERSRRERERANKRDGQFATRWNFLVSLFSDPQVAEDTISHLEEGYERDIKRYGVKRARLLYRKEALRSLGPLLKWTLHRTLVIAIVKHYFPGLESIIRLFR